MLITGNEAIISMVYDSLVKKLCKIYKLKHFKIKRRMPPVNKYRKGSIFLC